jgi:UDP-N-acetylglucosamine 2-epimerase (non-hydrolysing)
MKVALVLGTRPEIIKLSPIIRELERLRWGYFLLHTGQHYSYNMDEVFFEQLELPAPAYNLDVGSGTHAAQTGKMMMGIEEVLRQEAPDVVLVEGDTNTVLAGALAAVKIGITVGHVEAGLRSHDRAMPEEVNRVLADHCSDLLFAPTETSKQTLLSEGIAEDRISVTGNTIVDAVYRNLEISKRHAAVHDELEVTNGRYFLATVHRQENVDNEKRFRGILRGLKMVQEEFNSPLIYPIHPRARKQLHSFGLEAEGVLLVDPIDYLGFLQLESSARLVLTDSGGLQEEACILGVPCVTLRDYTERPETLEVGANVLAGVDPYEIVTKVEFMLKNGRRWRNPFGDGKAAERIIHVVGEQCD